MKSLVGSKEQRDIDKLVARILRDLGNPDPPIRLEQVRELLKLDLRYYSSTDVTPFAEFAHRIRVAGRQLAARPELLLDVLQKARLSGLWLPDNRGIYVDQETPEPKHRWIVAHEITHSYVPWHAEFLLGDTELTLEPSCHEVIEAEANFGAGKLLFLGDRFAKEAKDLAPAFASVQELKQRYGNTLTSTFWRFVEDRDPQLACFGIIGQHPRYPEIGGAGGRRVRYFIASAAFRSRFPSVNETIIFELMRPHTAWKKRGPVVAGDIQLPDMDGQNRTFRLDGFSNTYQVLTYGWLI